MADFTTHLAKRYRAKRLESGAAPATIDRELEIIERSLRLAAQCDPPKVARVIHIPMLTEDNIRTGFTEDAQYTRLLQELPEYLRALVVVGYHVGCRLGELLSLQWHQVDFDQNVITLLPGSTRNKKGRSLPIHGQMRERPAMASATNKVRFPGCSRVFSRDGQPIVDFRKAWRTACNRADLKGLLFHDLRRSAVRNMRLAGLPENVAMVFSGHKTRSVFDRYNIVSPKDLKDAVAKMESRLTNRLGTILGTIPEDASHGTASGSKSKLLN